MLDILLDSLFDLLKLLPFLFIAFLIIELIEHKFSKKTQDIIKNNSKMGPVVGSLLGAIPQCGFSVFATNLYVTRIVTLGTLIGIYLSTSDELLPVLISNKVDIKYILLFILLKVLLGIIFGFIIDLIVKPKKNTFHICEDDDCDCEESLIKSVIIHTLKTSLFIFIITFGLNMLFNYYESSLESIFINNKFITPFISSLIGLIPNCGSSIMISELYIKEVLTFGSTIAGLLTNSGVALLVLFKTNKNIKENLFILCILYLIGALVGVLINILQ